MSAILIDSDITTLVAVPGGVPDSVFSTGKMKASEAELLRKAGDVTCAIVQGYTLGMVASDEIPLARSVCDTANRKRLGAANYECEMDFFRESVEEALANESAYLRAAEMFTTQNQIIDWIRRGGNARSPKSAKPHDSPFVLGDILEIYRFRTDFPFYTSGQDSNKEATFHQIFKQDGLFNQHVELVAA